jgi:hypothetical protein
MKQSRLKTMVVALLAVFAVGVVASASASAHEFIIEGKAIKSGEKVPFELKPASPGNWSEIENAILQCNNMKGKGNLEAGGASSEILREDKFCKDTNNATTEANCEVVISTSWDGALGGVNPSEERFFDDPKAPFALVKVKNVAGKLCSYAPKTSEIRGTQYCALVEPAVEKVEHRVNCTSTGFSKLKGFEGAPWFYQESFNEKLVSGKKFSST